MTPEEFQAWAGDAAASCDEHTDAQFIVMVNDGDEALDCMAGRAGMPPDQQTQVINDQFERWMVQKRALAGMAVKASWAPNADEPTAESWALVLIAVDLPAGMWVRRIEEDKLWYRIDLDDMPWFALSTASGLRKMLETGEPLHVKSVKDRALYEKPTSGTTPPLDEQGRI